MFVQQEMSMKLCSGMKLHNTHSPSAYHPSLTLHEVNLLGRPKGCAEKYEF